MGKTSIETVVAIIDQKLKAGATSFAELRNRDDQLSTQLGVLEERMRPKPTNWLAVMVTLFSVMVTICGLVWGLNTWFSERPTRDELERDTALVKQRIDDITAEQRYLRDQLIEQRTLLKGATDTLLEMNKKLDTLQRTGRARASSP
jgi:septal ring factor EnvC (AmiA/AmiB activator)